MAGRQVYHASVENNDLIEEIEYLTKMMEALGLEPERLLVWHCRGDLGEIIKHRNSMRESVGKAIATKAEEAQSSQGSVRESTQRLSFAERADNSPARLAKSSDRFDSGLRQFAQFETSNKTFM
jgi:hypothetical protein